MRKAALLGLVISAGMSVSACTTYDRYGGGDRYGSSYDQYGYDRYGYNRDGYDRYGRDRNGRQLRDAATGAAVGAAIGAGLGAVTGGVSVGEGAVAGAVAGGIVGAVASENQRWYRDDRGGCYYVERDGYRHYDYDRRC
jgi:hypothetical protein